MISVYISPYKGRLFGVQVGVGFRGLGLAGLELGFRACRAGSAEVGTICVSPKVTVLETWTPKPTLRPQRNKGGPPYKLRVPARALGLFRGLGFRRFRACRFPV